MATMPQVVMEKFADMEATKFLATVDEDGTPNVDVCLDSTREFAQGVCASPPHRTIFGGHKLLYPASATMAALATGEECTAPNGSARFDSRSWPDAAALLP